MHKLYEMGNIASVPVFYRDLLLVYNRQNEFLFLSESDGSIIHHILVDYRYNFSIINDAIYMRKNDLYVYEDSLKDFVLYRQSIGGGSVNLFNGNFIENNYNRPTETVQVTLYDGLSDKKLWEKSFPKRTSWFCKGNYLYIKDLENKYIDFIDDRTGEVLNTLHFENPPISRFIYFYKDTLIVSLEIKPLEEYRLLGLDAQTGKEKWRVEDARYLYVQDLEKGYLYGIGGNLFQVIDVQNGKILFYERLTSEVEKYKVFPDRQGCLSPNGLYFYSNYPDCKFGLINLQTHKIEFVVDLNLSEGVKITDMSYHNGRLYISDTNKTLHIFAEE